jgi:hypothetical protein
MVLYQDYLEPKQQQLFSDWEADAEREQRSRTMFAQMSIKVDEVAREMDAVQRSVGNSADIPSFIRTAVQAAGGLVSGDNLLELNLAEARTSLREAVGADHVRLRVHGPLGSDERKLTRTEPVVEAIASYVLNSSLDPIEAGPAARCGVVRTANITTRTTLVLLRYRLHLITVRDGREHPLLAEDCGVVGFEGSTEEPHWLEPDKVERLLIARPTANVDQAQASAALRELLKDFDRLGPDLNAEANRRATDLLETHRRVRQGAGIPVGRLRVEAQVPPDVVGVYVFLPQPTQGS